METPIYDAVLRELDIDPAQQLGHDERVRAIVSSVPSKILAEEEGGGDGKWRGMNS